MIANPPYLDSENMANSDPELRTQIQACYSLTKGNWDIYIAFYEKAFALLQSDGVLSFITPDKWISKPFGDELRLQTNDKIISILKAGREIFKSSKVDAIVTLYGKKQSSQLNIYEIVGKKIAFRRTIEKTVLKPPYAYDWLFSDFTDQLAKIEEQPRTLSKEGLCENACATSDAYKLQPLIKEHSNGEDDVSQLKIINTGTIGKYVSKWGQREMTYLGKKYLRPVVNRRQFLRVFRKSYGKKSVKPKLIIKGLNLLDACIDSKGITIPGKTTLIVTCDGADKLKFLLALLNSTLAFFYLKQKYLASSYNQGTTFTKGMINNLPIPRVGDAERSKFAALVNRILAAKQAGDKAKAQKLETEIDDHVYRLYGLTPEEIALIENSMPGKSNLAEAES